MQATEKKIGFEVTELVLSRVCIQNQSTRADRGKTAARTTTTMVSNGTCVFRVCLVTSAAATAAAAAENNIAWLLRKGVQTK